jgi:hypothetical protein
MIFDDLGRQQTISLSVFANGLPKLLIGIGFFGFSWSEAAPKVRKNPEIADSRLRVFNYLSRFKTNIVGF